MNNLLVGAKLHYTKHFVQSQSPDILLSKLIRIFTENKSQNFKYYGNK